MAKGYNQVLEGISGKVGGMVVVTNGQQSIMRRRVFVNKSDSPAQQLQKANIAGLARLWDTLTPAEMSAWESLGGQMLDKGKTRRLSNYQAFTSVNALLLACGQPTVVAAPAFPTLPNSLPPVMLTASIGDLGFTLTISSAAYSSLVQVYAAAPASAGRNSFSRSVYKLIATLPSLVSGGNDVGDAYAARFGTPAGGRKIALRLVPVSSAGFAGVAVEPTALVFAPPAASQLGRDTQQSALKAA